MRQRHWGQILNSYRLHCGSERAASQTFRLSNHLGIQLGEFQLEKQNVMLRKTFRISPEGSDLWFLQGSTFFFFQMGKDGGLPLSYL